MGPTKQKINVEWDPTQIGLDRLRRGTQRGVHRKTCGAVRGRSGPTRQGLRGVSLRCSSARRHYGTGPPTVIPGMPCHVAPATWRNPISMDRFLGPTSPFPASSPKYQPSTLICTFLCRPCHSIILYQSRTRSREKIGIIFICVIFVVHYIIIEFFLLLYEIYSSVLYKVLMKSKGTIKSLKLRGFFFFF